MAFIDIDNLELRLDTKTECFFSVKTNEEKENLYVKVYKVKGVNKQEDAKRTISNIRDITDWKCTFDTVHVDKFVYSNKPWLSPDSILTDNGKLFIGILSIEKKAIDGLVDEKIVTFEINRQVSRMEEHLFVAMVKANGLMFVSKA